MHTMLSTSTTAFMPAAAVHSRTGLAQTARTSSAARHAISMGEKAYTLVLVRHGESTWNDENRCMKERYCILQVEHVLLVLGTSKHSRDLVAMVFCYLPNVGACA
jgi:hypothetical protein